MTPLEPDSYDPVITTDPGNRGILFEGITGRQGAQMGTPEAGLRGMLIAAYGTSRHDPTRPDTTKAAKALGVTTRTVQRWIAAEGKQRQKPRKETLDKLTTRARQAISTKRGRAAAIKSSRRKYAGGVRISITAHQGISSSYARDRHVSFDFDSPEMSERFFDAYEQGGERGVAQFLSAYSDEGYAVGSWYLGGISSFSLSEPYT